LLSSIMCEELMWFRVMSNFDAVPALPSLLAVCKL